MTYGIPAIERGEGAVQTDEIILIVSTQHAMAYQAGSSGRLFERSQKPPFQGGYTGSNPVPTIM